MNYETMPHRAEKFTGGHILRNYPFNIEQVNSEERKVGELYPCSTIPLTLNK
jgi:hypothetical protein